MGESRDVELIAYWAGEAGKLTDALREAGFIDEDPDRPGSFEIHDLFDHAPEYVQRRLSREIEREKKGVTISELRAAAGRKGGMASQSKKKQMEASNRHLLEEIKQTEQVGPTPAPAPAPENLTSSSESSDSDSPQSSGSGKNTEGVQAFFDLWNEEAKFLSKATKLTEGRKGKIRSRLRERPLDEWRQVFRRMERSSFLRGETGNGSFRGDLDWIIENEGNAIKVIEGRYDDREKRPAASPMRDVTGKIL